MDVPWYGCNLNEAEAEEAEAETDRQTDHIMHRWRMRVATYRHVGMPYLIYRQVVCFMCLPGLVTSYTRHRLSVRHRRWHVRPGRSGLCCSAGGSTRISPIGKYIPTLRAQDCLPASSAYKAGCMSSTIRSLPLGPTAGQEGTYKEIRIAIRLARVGIRSALSASSMNC